MVLLAAISFIYRIPLFVDYCTLWESYNKFREGTTTLIAPPGNWAESIGRSDQAVLPTSRYAFPRP